MAADPLKVLAEQVEAGMAVEAAWPGPVLPYMRIWVDDLLASPWVDAMSKADRDTYFLLLFKGWQLPAPCFLPNDPAVLAAWARLAGPMELPQIVLSRFERTTDGKHLFNRRALAEYLRSRAEYEATSSRGKKGASTRWGKQQSALPLDAQAVPEQCLSTSPSSARAIATRTYNSEETNTLPLSRSDERGAFAEFYKAYPRKKEPREAEQAFRKAVGRMVKARGVLPSVAESFLVAKAAEAARMWAEEGRPADRIPYPASWLNAGGYLDEPDQPLKPAVAAPAPPSFDYHAWAEEWRRKAGQRGVKDIPEDVVARFRAALKSAAIDAHSHETWLRPLRVGGLDHSAIVLLAPDLAFAHVGEKYGDQILAAAVAAGLPVDTAKVVTP